jgi:signal transduction histidine kinase
MMRPEVNRRGISFRARLLFAFVAIALLAALLGGLLLMVGLFRIGTISYIPQPNPTDRPSLRGQLRDFTSFTTQNLGSRPTTSLVLIAALVMVTAIGALVIAVTRGILRDVRAVSLAAERFALGERDVRLPIRGQDEFSQLVRSFNEMADALDQQVHQLEQLEARARRFSADVSHELRTPMATMLAVTDVLAQDTAARSRDGFQAAQLISSQTRQLAALVEDVVEISRFDAGVVQLQLSEVDIGLLLPTTLRRRAWTERVRLEVSPGTVIVADPRRVDVIVANLVANALRYGSPPVSVVAGPIAAGWLQIDVRDHGPGLDPADFSRVFDRFFKADAARDRSSGSGLGLAIAQENAAAHGGQIRAANHPDGGSVFSLQLPTGGDDGRRSAIVTRPARRHEIGGAEYRS